MFNRQFTDRLSRVGFLPIVDAKSPNELLALAEALSNGGISAVALSTSSPDCASTLMTLRQSNPEFLAGLCVTDDLPVSERMLRESDAEFLLVQGMEKWMVDMGTSVGVTVIPGINNPQGVADALESGTDVVAFYPACCSDGPAMLETLSRSNMRFIPWGGMDGSQAMEYLASPAVSAVAVDWFSGANTEDENQSRSFSEKAEQVVLYGLGFSLAHMGINMPDEGAAADNAEAMAAIFGLPLRTGRKSYFVSEQWEILKEKGPGAKGHMAIGTWSLERALHYLDYRCGVHALPDTIIYREDGIMQSAYIDYEIGGFAVHLLRKERSAATSKRNKRN